MSREQKRLPAELPHPVGSGESRQRLEDLTVRTLTVTGRKGRCETSEEVYDVRKNLNGEP